MCCFKGYQLQGKVINADSAFIILKILSVSQDGQVGQTQGAMILNFFGTSFQASRLIRLFKILNVHHNATLFLFWLNPPQSSHKGVKKYM